MEDNEYPKPKSFYGILGIILFIIWSVGGAYDVPDMINVGKLWHLLIIGTILSFSAFMLEHSRYDYFDDGEEDDDHIEFGGR